MRIENPATREELEIAIALGLTTYGLADKFDVCQKTICRWLKQHSLKTNHISTQLRRIPLKPCSICGQQTRNPKVCSQECKIAFSFEFATKIWTTRNIKELAEWKSGTFQPSERRCKSLLIFEREKKCEVCGWNEVNSYTKRIPVELEHKDGDCYNNKYENLSLLCPNHQSLTSTYRGANARKGRGRKMYKVVSRWARENNIGVSTGAAT